MRPKLSKEKQDAIISMALEGKSNRQIASLLEIDPATVVHYKDVARQDGRLPALYPTKRDCFAYNPVTHQCNALCEFVCRKDGKCSFYKPKEPTFETVMIQGGIIGK